MKRSDLIAIIVIGVLSGFLAIPTLKNIFPGLPFDVIGFDLLFVAGVTVCATFALWLTYKLSSWKPVFAQIGKFASVGVLNTLIDFGVLNALSLAFQVFSGPMVALFNAIGFIVANINSYAWNKYWTFQNASRKGAAEILQFFAVSVVGILLNTGIVYGATTFMSAPGGISASQWENAAKLIATVVSLVWNFFGYKFFVFKQKLPQPAL